MYEMSLYASLVIFLAVIAAYLRQPFASVFHPITLYLLFHGFVFVIRPVFAFYGDYEFIYRLYHFHPSSATKLTVIFAANLGLFAFVAAAWRFGNAPLVFKQSPIDLAHRKLMVKPFLIALALLAPIGIASLRSIMDGGFKSMMVVRGTGITVNTTGSGWFTDAQLLLVPCAMLFAWMFRFRWWSLLPLAGFVLGRSSIGGRGPFVVACVAVALAYLYERRERFPNWKTVLSGLLLLVLFVQVGDDRGQRVRILFGRSEAQEVIEPTPFMQRMDFANLEFFEFIVNTIPEKTGTYGYFVDNLQLFTEPIPRRLWKGKPVGPPIQMYNLFDYGNPVGMTSSLPGQGWAQLGYIGVVVWCWLWGMALGKAYTAFARSRQDTLAVGLYLCFLPAFVIAFRDGGLLTVARSVVFYLSPILVTALFARLLDVPPVELLERAARRARRKREAPPEQPQEAALLQPSRRRRAAATIIVPRSRRPRGPAPAE